MPEKISFVAAFPPVQSAIKISGDGNGARILLDIPESEMAEAVKLLLYRRMPLKVTIEVYEQEKSKTESNGTRDDNGHPAIKRSPAKRRVG